LGVEYLRKGAEVSQSDADKAKIAGQRSEETRSFARQVRAATRRKYTPEEKIRIVLEGFRREVTVNDLCRREGIKPHSYYAWTKEFMEAGKERLTRDTVRDATRQEIGELRRENGELKQLVGEISLQVSRLKKTAIPMLVDGVGTRG
jgi:transposase